MKLTWHIAKKDFLRLWPLLALWWGVLVLRAFGPALDFAAQMSGASRADLYAYGEIRPMALLVADILLLLLIATAAVQTDSPIKTGAYWRTLPLTGGRVLRAKILFFALFCGPPAALINLAAKIAYGFPSNELFAGLAWYEWKIAACILLGAMLATLFRHPLFTLLVVMILYGCCTILYDLPPIWFITVSRGKGWVGGGYFDPTYSLFLTRFLMWSNILLAAALGMAICRYLLRRRSWSWVVLVLGFVLAQMEQGTWSFDFFADDQGRLMPTPALPSEIPPFSLQFSPLQLAANVDYGYTDQYNAQFSAEITGLHSRHPGEAWLLSRGSWDISLPDGRKIDFDGGREPRIPVNYAEVLQALGLENLPSDKNEIEAYSYDTDQIIVNLLEQARTANPSPKVEGTLDFEVGPMTRSGDIAATPGAHFPRGPDYIAIHRISPMQAAEHTNIKTWETVDIELVTQSVGPAGAPLGPLNPFQRGNGYESRPALYFFVLWNPKRQEVVPASRWVWMGSPTDLSFDRYGENEGNGLSVVTSRDDLQFQIYKPAEAAQWSPEKVQAWLADARLVELRFTPEHDYTVLADIDHLDIPDHLAIPVSNPTAP